VTAGKVGMRRWHFTNRAGVCPREKPRARRGCAHRCACQRKRARQEAQIVRGPSCALRKIREARAAASCSFRSGVEAQDY